MGRTKTEIWAKRLSILAVFFLLLMLSLIIRMFEKQVLEHEHYLALAKNQQIYSQKELAKRGKILIHDDLEKQGSNVEIALDVKKYSVNVVPRNVKDKTKTASLLKDLIEMPENEIFEKINNDKLYIPPLAKKINDEIAEKIKSLNMPGVLILPEYSRLYPENNLLSQTIGFVNAENNGNYGLEGFYNNELKGYGGEKTGEKDTLGRIINLISEEPARDGDTLLLTIDRSVQYYVEKALEKGITEFQADSGTVIVVEPQSGRVIALANKPDFNPNEYNKVPQDQINIFQNQTITGAWEPGSIMKALTMASAIDAGLVTPETKGVYSNMVVVDGYEIHTALDKAFGEETMTQVLENSDNVAMVDIANKLGNQTMYDYIKKFGLLDKTGIDLSGESVGQVPRVKNWRPVNRATIAFGQGITLTPLQMVMGYAALANSGKLVSPRLVDKIIDCDGKETIVSTKEVGQPVQPSTAAMVKDMLVSVVVNGHGKKAAVPGFKVAGKTGTAQVPKVDGSGYEETMHIGSFAGFAPADNPKFAMIVRLNNPKTVEFAESSAAPIFGQIANYLLNYYYKVPASQ